MPSTVVSPPVARSVNVIAAGPMLTPGAHTTPRAPVEFSAHAGGNVPSKNGPKAGDGVEVANTPPTGMPPRITLATIDPDPGVRLMPFWIIMRLNKSARTTGIVIAA